MWDIPRPMKTPSAEQIAEFHAALHRTVFTPFEEKIVEDIADKLSKKLDGYYSSFVTLPEYTPEDDDTQEIDPPVEVGDAAT